MQMGLFLLSMYNPTNFAWRWSLTRGMASAASLRWYI